MKQIIMDKVDWIAYLIMLCLITTSLVYIPIKLHKIEKLLTPKAELVKVDLQEELTYFAGQQRELCGKR